MASRSLRARTGRILRTTGLVVAGLLVTIVALVGAVLGVADLPWGRRFAVEKLNAMLAPEFEGHIVVEGVESLGLGGVGGVSVRVQAPDGTNVLQARGVRARIAPIALLRSVLGHGDLQVNVFDVDVHALEVNLDTDDTGTLKVESAFAPRPTPAAPPRAPGRGLVLVFPRIAMEHAWIHGQMKGAPAVDADLDETLAAVRVAPGATAIDVSRLTLVTRGMPQGADARGHLEAHLAMPSARGADLGVWAAFDGTIGGIPTTASGALDGGRVDAVLDVPEVAAERVRALVPQVPLRRPVTAHVEAHGPLSAIAATLHAAAGKSKLDGVADVSVAGAMAATARIDARNVDLQDFSSTASPSDLDVSSEIRARANASGLYSGHYSIALTRGVLAGEALPRAILRGAFDQTDGGLRVDAAGDVTGPSGGPTTAAVQAEATVTLGDPLWLDASLQIAAERFEHANLHVDSARLDAHASGSAADPRIQAKLEARGVRAAGYEVREAHAGVEGHLSHERVTVSVLADPARSLRASGTVDLQAGPRVEQLDAVVARGPRSLHAHVDSAELVDGGVDVLGALVTGVGAPTRATFHLRPDSLVVKSDSDGIDLEKLGALLGMEQTFRKGRVGYVVDFAAHRGGVDGTAVIDMANACFGNIDGLTGHIDARMLGRKLLGAAQLQADGIGTLHVDPINVVLDGSEPLESASWRRAAGEVQLDGEFDLAKVVDLLPANALPVARVSGHLSLKAHVIRDKGADTPPDITVSLKTSGLSVASRSAPDAEKQGGIVLVAEPGWAVSGIDVQVNLEARGNAGIGEGGGAPGRPPRPLALLHGRQRRDPVSVSHGLARPPAGAPAGDPLDGEARDAVAPPRPPAGRSSRRRRPWDSRARVVDGGHGPRAADEAGGQGERRAVRQLAQAGAARCRGEGPVRRGDGDRERHGARPRPRAPSRGGPREREHRRPPRGKGRRPVGRVGERRPRELSPLGDPGALRPAASRHGDRQGRPHRSAQERASQARSGDRRPSRRKAEIRSRNGAGRLRRARGRSRPSSRSGRRRLREREGEVGPSLGRRARAFGRCLRLHPGVALGQEVPDRLSRAVHAIHARHPRRGRRRRRPASPSNQTGSPRWPGRSR